MASLHDKAALFDSCKFLTQLKTRGEKHLDKVLRVKSKGGAKDAMAVKVHTPTQIVFVLHPVSVFVCENGQVERIKGVSIGDDLEVIQEDLDMVRLSRTLPGMLFSCLCACVLVSV